MPNPTFTKHADWGNRNNHEAPHDLNDVTELALDGLNFLKVNTLAIKNRASSPLGVSSFFRSLIGLGEAMAPSAPAWTAEIFKGIHQFKKKGAWHPPHITVKTPQGTAHLWLSIGAVFKVVGDNSIIIPRSDIGGQQHCPAKADFSYRVAQISLKEEGPFFPGVVGFVVWTPTGFNRPIIS